MKSLLSQQFLERHHRASGAAVVRMLAMSDHIEADGPRFGKQLLCDAAEANESERRSLEPLHRRAGREIVFARLGPQRERRQYSAQARIRASA